MRRTNVEPIGLSFIDLVSCAFCAVLVLFLIQENTTSPPFSDDPIETEHVGSSLRLVWDPTGNNSDPQVIVRTEGREYRSWDQNGLGVSWSRAPGKLIGVVNDSMEGTIEYVVLNRLEDVNDFKKVFEFTFYPAGMPGSEKIIIKDDQFYRVSR